VPKVIFNIGFCPASPKRSWNSEKKAEWLSNRAFYTCRADYNYFSYTTKDGKVNTETDEDTPRAYGDGTQGSKRGSYMEKTSGVFSDKGVLSNTQKKELEEKLKATKSNVWHGFVSFDPETTPVMNSQKACIDFVRANMGSYLRETHLKPENLEVFYSLHTDTDNAHIHFCFFEKEPLRLNSKGEACYTEKGVFGKKIDGKFVDTARDNFLLTAELYLDGHKYDLERARDGSMEILKAAAPEIAERKQYRELRAELASLGKKLPREGRLSYNSANMKPLKPDVDRAVRKLVDTVPGMRTAYADTVKELLRRETEAKRICAEQGLDFNLIGKPRFEAARRDFGARLGNAVIKLSKTTRCDKFADTAFVTNDLARKISARKNRVSIARAVRAFAGTAAHFVSGAADFTALHIAEREIEREQRQAAYPFDPAYRTARAANA
jgi:hypothetical protein